MITYKLATLCLLICTGCAASRAPVAVPVEVSQKTYHLHLPGIAGGNLVEWWWCATIDSALPATTTDFYDWTGHKMPIDALQAYSANHQEAKKIADRITKYRRDHPNARMILTAESGGAGPAVWALEYLPGDVAVDSVILMSPALSPSYDLSTALRHVRTNVHVFTSVQDDFILGWGTRKFGTIDGQHTESAGRRGFVAPPNADAHEYSKIVQVPYQAGWWKYLNFGGHAEAMSPAFAKYVVAPLIADGRLPG